MTHRHTAPLLLLALLLLVTACAVADDRIPQATLLGVPVDIEEVTSNEGEGSVTMTELPSDPDDPATDRWTVYFLSDGLYYVDDAGTVVGPLIDASGAVTDHGSLTGLTDDDHAQYTLLAGRSGGQTLNGGTGAGENLVLDSTANASKGVISVPDSTVVLEASTPLRILDNGGSAFAQFSILSGTDLRIIGGSGVTDFNVASLDTSVASLDSASTVDAVNDITTSTGDINAQAGNLQTGGTTRIDSAGAGTLTNLDVDNVNINANSITGTGDLILNEASTSFPTIQLGESGATYTTLKPQGTAGIGVEFWRAAPRLDIDAPGISTTDPVVRMFRDTNTSGTPQVQFYRGDGTSTQTVSINSDSGDITAATGNVLVTAGGVGIGSGAPSAKLHVDDGGTTPAIAATTLAIFQDSNAGNSQAWISILGGNATSGQAGINFGHQADENNAAFWSDFTPTTGGLRWRTNGSGVDMQMDYSGNLLLYNSFDVQGTATVGSSSNTRWDQSSILDGYAYSTGTTPTLTATNGSTYYTFPDQASAAYVVLPIKAVLGSKVKAVKAYYYGTFTSAASIIGVDIKAATNAGVLVSVGTRATASISSTGAGTVTQSLGTASSVAAGLPLYAVIDRTDNLGDATFLLTAVEIQYEEREY